MTEYNSPDRLRRVRILGVMLALALMTAGCGSDATPWSPAASPKENHIALVHLDHDVAFAQSSVQIDTAALNGLEAFLDRNEIGYGDRIYVVASGGTPNPIATRRAETIALLLRREGLEPMVLPSAEWAGSPSPNAVRVLVHRFVVRTPGCPDWRKPAKADYANTVSSNFGCATAVNLGLMVADPRELVEGHPEGPADGTREAAAVKRYRDGKITPLEKSGISQ